jgi:hypothetical protein
VIGVCFDDDTGRTYEDYVTVYTPIPFGAYLRGRPEDKYKFCPHCGAHDVFSVDPNIREYFARSTLAPWRDAYQEHTHGTFVITSKLRDQIDWSRFPEISFYEYPLIDEPIDGRTLAGDPDYIPIWEREQS